MNEIKTEKVLYRVFDDLYTCKDDAERLLNDDRWSHKEKVQTVVVDTDKALRDELAVSGVINMSEWNCTVVKVVK